MQESPAEIQVCLLFNNSLSRISGSQNRAIHSVLSAWKGLKIKFFLVLLHTSHIKGAKSKNRTQQAYLQNFHIGFFVILLDVWGCDWRETLPSENLWLITGGKTFSTLQISGGLFHWGGRWAETSVYVHEVNLSFWVFRIVVHCWWRGYAQQTFTICSKRRKMGH